MCVYVVMGNSPQLGCCIVREPKMPRGCNAMGVLLSCRIIVYTYICAWCSVLGWGVGGGEVAAVLNKSYHVLSLRVYYIRIVQTVLYSQWYLVRQRFYIANCVPSVWSASDICPKLITGKE